MLHWNVTLDHFGDHYALHSPIVQVIAIPVFAENADCSRDWPLHRSAMHVKQKDSSGNQISLFLR